MKSLRQPYEVYEDEAKALLTKFLQVAIKDYLRYKGSKRMTQKEAHYFSTAKSLLFDSEHTIQWGDLQLSLADILDLLEWDEKRIPSLLEEHMNEGGIIPL